MVRSSYILPHTAWFALLLPLALTTAACSDGENTSTEDGLAGNANSGGKSGSGGSDSGSAGDTGSAGAAADSGAAGEGGGEGVPDTTAPTVVASDPEDEATGEATNRTITATFNEAMDPETLTDATFSLSRGDVEIPGTVSYFNRKIFFAPTDELELGETYSATITTTAADPAGNELEEQYTWSFTTDDQPRVGPAPVVLGAAGEYVILAKSEISNVPTSEVTGDVGLSPAAASYVTGFALTRAGTKWTSPQVVGGVFAADNDPPTPTDLTVAVSNMQTAYTNAAGRPTPDETDLEAGIIGGLTLTPGLYKWGSSVTIPADITISGGANDVWIFQISGDLKMSSAKKMIMSGGARAKNVFWQVAGFVELGTSAHAEGIMLVKTKIVLGTDASINGRLLAQTAVNIAKSTVTAPAP
jgi:hypothetical protein